LARGACILIDTWEADTVCEEYEFVCECCVDYVPGQFYRRELPCLLGVLGTVQHPLEVVVIDGYVSLDENGSPGLGMYLYHALGDTVAVVGIAKRALLTFVWHRAWLPGRESCLRRPPTRVGGAVPGAF